MHIKKELFRKCKEFVDLRLQTLQTSIADIQQSLTSETKSSAGDKHETGRAMLQIEREKAGSQLAEVQKLNEALSKIDINLQSNKAILGSLAYTSLDNYFISISAGEFNINNKKFYAISPTTPIGQLLIGKKVGDLVAFRGNDFKIERIE